MNEKPRPRLLFAGFALLAALVAVAVAQDDRDEPDPLTCAAETAFYSDAITLLRQIREARSAAPLSDLERGIYEVERIEHNFAFARLSFEDCARRQMRLPRR